MQNEDYLVWKQVTMDEQVVFDSKALNGLRGLAALHILIFHAFYCSTLNINILGAVREPYILGWGLFLFKRFFDCLGTKSTIFPSIRILPNIESC